MPILVRVATRRTKPTRRTTLSGACAPIPGAPTYGCTQAPLAATVCVRCRASASSSCVVRCAHCCTHGEGAVSSLASDGVRVLSPCGHDADLTRVPDGHGHRAQRREALSVCVCCVCVRVCRARQVHPAAPRRPWTWAATRRWRWPSTACARSRSSRPRRSCSPPRAAARSAGRRFVRRPTWRPPASRCWAPVSRATTPPRRRRPPRRACCRGWCPASAAVAARAPAPPPPRRRRSPRAAPRRSRPTAPPRRSRPPPPTSARARGRPRSSPPSRMWWCCTRATPSPPATSGWRTASRACTRRT